jgi:adenylate cyclase
MPRKLTAIVSADVQSFSRLMGEDEGATVHALHACREVTDALIHQYRGRIVGTAGDSILAEFASVVDAVQCAVEIQRELKSKNAELPEHRRMELRIGINLGDVIVDGEQIYGDGVNIAARVQALADAGGICISGTVHEHIKNKLALQYEDLGEQEVKNIAAPVRVLKVVVAVPSPSVAPASSLPASPPVAQASGLQAAGTAALPAGQGEGAFREAGSAKFKVQRPQSKIPSPKTEVQSPKPRRVGIAHLRWVVVGLVLLAGTLGAVRYLFLLTPNPQLPTPNPQDSAPSPAPPLSTQDSALSTQAPQALALPDKPSLIVLPLTNMSGDPAQDYFSDGLTEVLTADLSRISSLFVIARNTAFTYKGKATNVQEVGHELGVRYVLEGSVQKADNQVRIVVQLIDATTGGHLWIERYDRPLKNIFALQDDIVQKIVTTLKLQLGLIEQGVLVRKTTDNLEAYDYYLRAFEYCCRFTQEANAKGRQLYEKAIVLDPRYADAYAALGGTYLTEWVFQWSQDPQVLQHALELAQKAIAIDDSVPGAYGVLGFVYLLRKQYDQAIAAAERAIALNPNSADGYSGLASISSFVGRSAEAVGLMEKAMRLNPRSPVTYLFELGEDCA